MLVELRHKSQVTIPKEIIKDMGLSEGAQFEVYEKDGAIILSPVEVYPKGYIDELRGEIDDVKAKVEAGEQPIFDNVDALLAKLDDD